MGSGCCRCCCAKTHPPSVDSDRALVDIPPDQNHVDTFLQDPLDSKTEPQTPPVHARKLSRNDRKPSEEEEEQSLRKRTLQEKAPTNHNHPSKSHHFTKFNLSEKNPMELIDGYQREIPHSLEHALEPFEDQIHGLPMKIEEAKKKCYYPNEHGLTHDQSAAIYLLSMEFDGNGVEEVLRKAWQSNDRSQMKPWAKYLNLLLSGLNKLPDVPRETCPPIEFDAEQRELLQQQSHPVFITLTFYRIRKNDLEKSSRSNSDQAKTIPAKDITKYVENQDQQTVALLPGMKLNQMKSKENHGKPTGHLSRHSSHPSVNGEPSSLHFICPNVRCRNACRTKHDQGHCHGLTRLHHACRHHCGPTYACDRCQDHQTTLFQCSKCDRRFCKACSFS